MMNTSLWAKWSCICLSRKVESISPAGSLSPAEHERVSPDLFKGYSQPELITGLSSANYHGKFVLNDVLPIPNGVHQIP